LLEAILLEEECGPEIIARRTMTEGQAKEGLGDDGGRNEGDASSTT